ncbi:hypothetical protein F2P56_000928 [Juglans regia]|uniref:Uncharacterized protein n=1 Tax=Juglans regia TaxID=51240 RepID=A0A833YBB2_JUGRE|nr:hypothetical protein F2P56_000928 [Juglans regia]
MGKKEIMGTELKKERLVASFAVLLLISLGTNQSAAASTFDGNKILSRNATIAEEVQPLMESEVSRRFLQANPVNIYKTQGRGRVCNLMLYGDCIKPIKENSGRPCTVYNRCQRGAVHSQL